MSESTIDVDTYGVANLGSLVSWISTEMPDLERADVEDSMSALIVNAAAQIEKWAAEVLGGEIKRLDSLATKAADAAEFYSAVDVIVAGQIAVPKEEPTYVL